MMQRYIVPQRTGIEGLKLERDATAPELRGQNDVRPLSANTGRIAYEIIADQNSNQGVIAKRTGCTDSA